MGMERVVVIGAGVGGLTAGAILARAGLDVTVLEAQVYSGGCAGTFYHKGYRFDAGATLAGGFYAGGPMELVARAAGIEDWGGRAMRPAMMVHLPDGTRIARRGDQARWAARSAAFGAESLAFWRWQEQTADAVWDLALRLPPWPPQSARDLLSLAGCGLAWLRADAGRLRPGLAADAWRPVAAHLRGVPERLRLFVDAQLLISAQTTSPFANALYGAAALDLPRRGVVHFEGGMGHIAETLVAAVRRNGGRVLHRQEATRIVIERGRPVAVETRHGESYSADVVVANLPPWNIAHLLGEDAPRRLRHLPPYPRDGWGAFVVYMGVDGAAIPPDLPLHHQVVAGEPLGEGNSVFLSISPAWDRGRAPAGRRAVTLSTHTRLAPWWDAHAGDPEAYQARKAAYTERVLAVAGKALPGLREAADLVMPGTPVTFQRFTRRVWGWVGGFPQTDLLRAWGPRLAPGLWMVGDSIFPGQSTAAVALGGLRVARMLLESVGARLEDVMVGSENRVAGRRVDRAAASLKRL